MAKGRGKKGRSKGKGKSRSRRLALRAGIGLALFLTVWGLVSEWYVHHPRAWLRQAYASCPTFLTAPLYWFGNPLADITDGLGWTGHDAIYEYDEQAPSGEVFFAGAPRRTGAPAPTDIRIIDRGHFKVGWSDSLRHPVWCAYHVVPDVRHDCDKRPGFTRDHAIASAPRPDDYKNSGYDRGHMVPNYAITTRYGLEEQKKTFMMSNIAPQTPALNRGVWRDVEHRIAELWTARYGEIWVIVGCLSNPNGGEKLPGTDIDVPTGFYQLIVAQEGLDVRMMAMLFNQRISWHEWAARNLITVDELEQLTGLDFNPDLPGFIQEPLEADLPSRLWPIRVCDILKQIFLRFRY